MSKSLSEIKATCIIPARLASSRFPNKPLAKINGRELVLRVADIASACVNVDRVLVATEDDAIRCLCESNGFEVRVTTEQPTCTHRVAEVARSLESDYIVNLQGDEPLMSPGTIDDVIRYHIQEHNQVTQAVYPVTADDINDPDCVKCVVNNGRVIYLTRRPESIARNLFGIAGLYVYDRNAIINYNSYDLAIVEASGGLDTFGFIGRVDVIPYVLVSRTWAIDRPTDIAKVEECLLEGKG